MQLKIAERQTGRVFFCLVYTKKCQVLGYHNVQLLIFVSNMLWSVGEEKAGRLQRTFCLLLFSLCCHVTSRNSKQLSRIFICFFSTYLCKKPKPIGRRVSEHHLKSSLWEGEGRSESGGWIKARCKGCHSVLGVTIHPRALPTVSLSARVLVFPSGPTDGS